MTTPISEPQESPSQFASCDISDSLLGDLYKIHLRDQAELIAKAGGLNANDITKFTGDDSSALGAWLRGKGMQQFGDTKDFELLLAAHQTYRCVIAIVANVAARGKATSFQQALIESVHLKSASLAVGVAAKNLRSAI